MVGIFLIGVLLLTGSISAATGNTDGVALCGAVAVAFLLLEDLKYKFWYAALVALAGSLVLTFNHVTPADAVGLGLTVALVVAAMKNGKEAPATAQP